MSDELRVMITDRGTRQLFRSGQLASVGLYTHPRPNPAGEYPRSQTSQGSQVLPPLYHGIAGAVLLAGGLRPLTTSEIPGRRLSPLAAGHLKVSLRVASRPVTPLASARPSGRPATPFVSRGGGFPGVGYGTSGLPYD